MRRLKILLGISLIVNIVLAFWIWRNQAEMNETDRVMREGIGMLDDMHTATGKLKDDIKTRTYRTIAATDQLDAFLEEHRHA